MSDLFLRGLGNELQSESLAGSLPLGRNSPQRLPFGLHAEQLSGTAFTAPRHLNRRSWLYRRRPSVMHGPFKPLSHEGIQPAEINTPNRLRWNPPPLPEAPCDWLEGLGTLAGNGSISDSTGATIHLYRCNRPMVEVAFSSADGELLLAPQQGRLNLITEFGRLTAAPGEIALVPRGCRFRVEVDEDCRGYCLENHGAPFMLPDLGPIGSNGLASARDFLAPSAATEEDAPHRLIVKYEGRLWESRISHSPFDVVAWRGNLFPCTYDLAHFNVLGTISFDHPDPSIFTVLTSPSGLPGVANCDFVIFPPRWMVAEDTFRPPWFHRNFMSEYMGLIRGSYDARKGGFMPGGGSLHNRMSAHGPDRATTEAAQSAELAPVKYDDGLAFMFESMRPWRLTRRAMETDLLQSGYDEIWQGF